MALHELPSRPSLDAEAARLAAGLRRWGLRRGDRIAFFLSNRQEFVVAYLAAGLLGAIAVPINPRYRRVELGHILSDALPRVLITEREQLPHLDDVVASDRASLEAIITAEEIETWKTAAGDFDPAPLERDDVVLLIYTSGTTGPSKGAMLTRGNVAATVQALLTAWEWSEGDRLLLTLPLFHVHGLIVGLGCALAAGASVLLPPRFDADDALDRLAAGEATLFFGVPAMYVRLIEALEQRPRRDFSRVRLFCSGSAPLAPETMAAFERLTGHTILERYGMTETGMNLSNPYRGPRVPGSVGTPLPGVSIRIVDESGADVAAGEPGELLVHGNNVFAGYWQAPEKTAAAFDLDADGIRWFRTGDLARRDAASGYVTLLGRRHDLILSGGFNVYPLEIEAVLTSFPGVAEASVVGRPHPRWGETPVAYLVCSQAVDREALLAHCRSRLAGFKVPSEVHVLDALPRNAMGKIQRSLLP
jgi:malonyl-CoA/methylmalonyl-CoA synthetase